MACCTSNFGSDTYNVPNCSVECLSSATMGSVFVGANASVWIMTGDDPCVLDSWTLMDGSSSSFDCTLLADCSIDSLLDVDITGINLNQTLSWNGTSLVPTNLIPGPPGEQGPQGEQGIQGIQGEIGPQGPPVEFECEMLDDCSIDALGDVVTTGAANGQSLVYNGTLWLPGSPAAPPFDCADLNTCSIDALVDVDTTTVPPNVNSKMKWDGTHWIPEFPAFARFVVGGGSGGVDLPPGSYRTGNISGPIPVFNAVILTDIPTGMVSGPFPDFSITIPENGIYDINIRIRARSADTDMLLVNALVNGGSIEPLQFVMHLPNTNTYNTSELVAPALTLTTGQVVNAEVSFFSGTVTLAEIVLAVSKRW